MSLSTIILLPLLGALINGGYALGLAHRRRLPARAFVNLVGVGLPFAAFALTLRLSWPFFQGQETPLAQHLFSWIAVGNFQADAALALDRLSALMTLIVTGVGSLIHLYSTGYMKEDPGYAKYFSFLNLFLAAMLILVLADNLLLLFVGWEGVGLCSYLLIGFWFEDPAKAYAGKKAFIVNRIGDFGFLIGIFFIVSLLLPQAHPGDYILSFAYLQQNVSWLAGAAGVITLFLFIGATGKSAQIPLYVWLPHAMAGPTPVSALIHAATMVTAGIYMIARLHFLYDLAPGTLQLVAILGAVTAIWSALIGLVQTDIKKVLAYSTVSQLGYMFLGVGVGAYGAGVFHLMTHAFFKACLFLGAGSVIHAMSGEQDIRKMGGLRKALPVTFSTFLIATIAIAGIPPLSGFFSKDEILWQAFHRGHTVLWAVGFAAAGLTSFYMFRLVSLTFLGKSRASEAAKHHLHESPPSMTSVLIVLALLSLVGGWVGIPHALGGHNYFESWLQLGVDHGAGHDSLAMERNMAILSALWAVLVSAFALFIYLRHPEWPTRWAAGARALYRLLLNKFYVDEIYQALIVRPIRLTSEFLLARVVDEGLIDGGMVRGSGRLASWAGSAVNLLQSGLANNYAFYFLIALGAFVIFGVIL